MEYAKRKGYRVIVCDRDPQARGFRLADTAYQISTDDRGGVLETARTERVDGVLGYATDVGAQTAAYVAERLGLPGNHPDCVDLLIDKPRFQSLCRSIGINAVEARSFDADSVAAIGDYVERVGLPLVIKPALSSGSRGVSIVHAKDQWRKAAQNAFANTRNGGIVVEQVVKRVGHQICGDGFVVGGKLVFVSFGDGHFYSDTRFLAPFGETFPSRHPPEHLRRAYDALAKVVSAAGMKAGGLNFDIAIKADGSAHIFDLSPRSGGNFIPDAIHLHTGVNLIEACVEACLSDTCRLPANATQARWPIACYMIHTLKDGRFAGVKVAPEIDANIVRTTLLLDEGAEVLSFTDAAKSIGNVLLRFSSEDELHQKFERIRDLISPKIH